MNFTRTFGTLFISVGGWLLAVGLYLLIRFYGTHDTMDWATGPAAMIAAWLVSGSVLGTAYWITSGISDHPAFRKRSYGFLILFRTLVMVTGLVLVAAVTRLLAVVQGTATIQEFGTTFLARLTSKPMLVATLYVAIVTAVFSFFQQMNRMIGPRVLRNLVLGKYRTPKNEPRIFMFLDLKGSTALAERLGHETFCRLIQDCFRDLTDSAIRQQVEIYQYVGDEAILTWRPAEGLADCNCLRVFFDYQQVLGQRAAYYEATYGAVPRFKAGANFGPVTTAEVGIIRRDIAYLSDVLNTASRIQGLCNEYDRDLLIAGPLHEALKLPPDLRFDHVGTTALRGRDESVEIYAVEQAQGQKGEHWSTQLRSM